MPKDKKEIASSSKVKSGKGKDAQETLPLLPPGLTNHTNTCFFNGTLQSLIATQLLEETLNFRPTPTFQHPSSPTLIIPDRSPALTNGRGGIYKRGWESGMPISDAFLALMERAWAARDSRSRVTLSPKDLLDRVGDKYSQYLDFRQQDAHELMRHILDGMRMEELDMIKKRQPPPKLLPNAAKKGPGSASTASPPPAAASGSCAEGSAEQPLPSIAEEERLYPFVDMIFGGKLASILVCEGCKHISHTYEDFNDLSLSLKPEEKSSRRDRLKHFAQKFMKSPPSPAPSSPSLVPSTSATLPNPPSVAPLPPPISLPIASPMPTHAPPRPAFILSEIPRSHSVPPQPSASNTPLQQLTEAAPSDVNRRRSAEYTRAHAEFERTSSLTMSATSNASTTLLDSSSASSGVKPPPPESENLTVEPQAEGFGTKLGRRMSKRLGIKVKRKDKIKTKDAVGSGIEDAPTEEEIETRGRDETQHSGVDEPLKQPTSSGRTSFFSFTPSGSRANSPHPPMSDNAPTASLPLASEVARAARKKEKAQRKAQRKHGEAAYLRAILKDEPSSGSTNPLWKLATSAASAAVLSGAVPGSHPSTAASTAAQANLWNKLGSSPGILECLRQFTAVEALDGDNSFACRNCWKLANPHLVRKRRKYRNQRRDNTNVGLDSDDEASSASSDSSSSEDDEPEPRLHQPGQGDPLRIPLPDSRAVSPLPPVTTPASEISLDLLRPQFALSTNAIEIVPLDVDPLNTVDLSSSVASAPGALAGPLPSSSGQIIITRPDEEASQAGPGPDKWAGMPIPAISTTSVDISEPLPPSSTDHNPTHSSGFLGPNSSRDDLRLGRSGIRNMRKRSAQAGESPPSDADLSSDDSEREGGSVSSVTTGSDSPSAAVRAQLKGTPQPKPARMPRPPRSQRVIRRRALKRYLIAAPPPVLVIHLKRFQQVTKGPVTMFGNFKKLDEYVSFPEHLDLSSIIAPKREDFGLGKKRSTAQPVKTEAKERGRPVSKDGAGAKHDWWKFGLDSVAQKREEMKVIYRLYAVVVHMGSMLGGHYVAYTALRSDPASNEPVLTGSNTVTPVTTEDQHAEKQTSTPPNEAERQWCFVSDTVVRPADLEEVLKAKAYLCFYERVL